MSAAAERPVQAGGQMALPVTVVNTYASEAERTPWAVIEIRTRWAGFNLAVPLDELHPCPRDASNLLADLYRARQP